MDKGENQGFSLVELLVSVAILSIVLLVVTTAMVTGSKNFTRGNADAGMQREAQLLVDQIEDMIIDSNVGINFKAEADGSELVLYNTTDGGGSFTEEVIKWNSDDNKLTYSQWEVTYDDVAGKYVRSGAALYDDALLTQNISDFSVDLSDEKKEPGTGGSEITVIRSVKVKVGCIGNGGQVTYATSAVISLRNRMLLITI
jgi:prepilin-type N-terminal cleavage/methylation domain-containing protein